MPDPTPAPGVATTGVRRFLIATATTRHRRESGLDDRPELLDERTRMVALFETLGYTTVAGFGENLATERWRDQLRGFLSSPQRRPDDIIVVYHTGHGLADGDNLLLPMADTAADPTKAVWVEDLTGRLLRGTHIRRLLIILDTCHSAVGGAALAYGATAFLGRLRGLDTNPAAAVIVSARPTEEAEAGAFTQAFAAAVAHRATGGVDSPYLPLDGVVDVINATTPGHQHARLFYLGDTVAEFLPNPRYDPHLRNLDLWAQDRARQREARRAERRDHVLPRAQGIDTPATQDLWLYTGRHQALRHVCNWLDQPTAPPTMIITGDPGSGKSALLARLFVLARTDIRGRVPDVHTLPADTIPPMDVFTEFIHARGQTPDGLLTAIAHACGLNPSDTVSDLVTGLRTAGRPVVLIIDAVDEAAHTQSDGFPVVDQILAPLVRAAASRDVPLRLLLGTRRHLIEALGQPAEVLNLDADEYTDLDSLRDYAVTCLTRVTDTSPYRHQPRHYLDRVAGAIAQAAGRSFLVALITARSLALQSHLPDPDIQTWRANLPTIPADAMRADLATRLGPDADTARALLLPLAYAEGNGLPWEDLWPALATALADHPYTSDHLDWLITHAGFYITETTTEDGRRSVYRLFHEALAEHLRTNRDHTTDQATITRLLIDRVPRLEDGHPNWPAAHPYTRTHLATHAARAHHIDHLLLDPLYLLHATPGALHAALPAADTEAAHTASSAYRHTLPHLRTDNPAETKTAYLLLAAVCTRATPLATAIRHRNLPLAWTTEAAVWKTNSPHQTLTGHTGGVLSVTVGRVDGRDIIVSGSYDGMVCCWDDATQHPGATLRHRIQVGAPVRATVVTDSGRLVVGADLGLIVLRLTT